MKPALLVLLPLAALAAVEFRPAENDPGWRPTAQRAEIAPRTYLDRTVYRSEPASLAIAGAGNAAAYGGWEYTAAGITPGRWYRLTAYSRVEGAGYRPLHSLARLDWAEASGKRAGQPEYAYRRESRGGWDQVTLEAPAPEKAAAVKVQLLLGHAPGATAFWDDVSLVEIPAPGVRGVRVAALNYRPGRRVADNVAAFVQAVDAAVKDDADIILLPEGITVVDTGKKYLDVAEPVPGPSTRALGELARRRKAYVVAGIFEREGAAVYNTAVLLDRQGRLAGKYRKVYLPREEIEGGLTPGSEYPVFDTDFGVVGLMICWDVQYADPARALALRGAELILMPIWGGNETLAKARAIENQVFLATSGYGFPTYIIDPNGEVLSQAPQRGAAAVATLDLNRRYVDPWLGNMRGRFMKELRLDLPADSEAIR